MIPDQLTAEESWPAFVAALERDILPLYQRHEQTFDWGGIHGRMHICRAVLFAETMARFYSARQLADVDLCAVRTAIAFHDSGRQGSGEDLWESDSAQLCYEYLRRSRAEPYARYVGDLIEKHGVWDLARRIVHDADVLEIMRPCCSHGGLPGFERRYFRFLSSRDPEAHELPGAEVAALREALIQEAWAWIEQTETLKSQLAASPAYMSELLRLLQAERSRYPMLAMLVAA